jgi:hypothetical protein
MNGNGAEAVLDSFTRQMNRLPAGLRKSMTCDRGSEMACHPEQAWHLKIDIWFCDPHCSLAVWPQQEHQRPAASGYAKGHRPRRHQSDLVERCRSTHE